MRTSALVEPLKKLIQKMATGYGGYPVTTKSEHLEQQAVTPENEASYKSNRHHSLYQPRLRQDAAERMQQERALKRRAEEVRRRAKGKADPGSKLFTGWVTGNRSRPTAIPGAEFAFRPDNLLMGTQGSDTMGMIFKGSAELRRKIRDKTVNWCPTGDRECREGGEIPSNAKTPLYPHSYDSRRQTTRSGVPVWGTTR